MPSYNLLDEPWIPCLRGAHEPPRLLGLREVFAEAPRLALLADPAPTVTIALHRLVLAILHRSLDGPRNAREWDAVWRAGAWDPAAIYAYLDRWRDRFDLFHPEHPFYQTAGLDPATFREVSQLTHDRASDRKRPLLFDHTLPGSGLAPDAAARYVIAQQAFSVGGMISYNPGREPTDARHAKASPLLGSAVCLVKGATLFRTLMLNWHQYSRESETPFPFNGDDRPAWERDDPTRPVGRIPDGYVDLLTWQARRILLAPEHLPDGRVVVRSAALMKGYWFPDSFEPFTSETMVAFRKRAQAMQGPAWVPVGLEPERTVWRDSHALFRSVVDQQARPRMLDWLGDLIASGCLGDSPVLPLDVHGLIPDQAKVLDWRRETLPLPLAFVREPEMVDALKEGLELAEQVSQLLQASKLNLQLRDGKLSGPSPLWVLSEELLRGTAERSPKAGDVGALARRLSTVEGFWAPLDGAFRWLVIGLPGDAVTDEYGDQHYGGKVLPAWAGEVEQSARRAFDAAVAGLDSSGRSLRAVAKARGRFSQCLARLMTPYRPARGQEGGAA